MRIRGHDFTLLAQGIAIVLPVIALSGIALSFLREDRVAIDREAVHQAQAYLQGEVTALQQEVKSGIEHAMVFGTIRNGSLWISGDYSQVPELRWSESSTMLQLQLLDSSNSPDAMQRAVALAIRRPTSYETHSGIPIPVRAMEVALRHARGGALPPYVLNALHATVREYPDRSDGLLRLAASVSAGQSARQLAAIQEALPPLDRSRVEHRGELFDPYADLQRLEGAERRHASDVVAQAIEVAVRSRGMVTPAGTPIAPLALLIGLRSVDGGVLTPPMLSALRSQVEQNPSFLTPDVLEAAAQVAKGESAAQVAAMAGEWKLAEDEREKKRSLLRKVGAELVGLTGAAALLPDGPSGEWLALCDRWIDGWSVRVIPNLTPRPKKSYFGLMVEIDWQRWWLDGPENPHAKVLASSKGRLNGDAVQHIYTVNVVLADPDQLYGPFQRRMLFTRLLTFCAAVTALIGLASLWSSYRRQARLSEMKSNFVSSVSHELRAPLAAVRLMAESLDGGRVVEEEKRRDYYRVIVQECRRLSGLVENVLDLSRIGDGRANYRFEPVDLAALLRQSVAIMEPCAAERQVTLRLAPDAAAGWQPCWDGAAVAQALVNLLDNAVKHSPAGSIVDIGAEQDGGKVRVWVADSGPGIPAREHGRIFELFYRRGTELLRETKGVGIGLAIVRTVAEAHGGRVIVESEVGRGSRFTLELPMERPS